jgi:L-arabinokinase
VAERRIAVVCSAHGFGHLTRSLALAEALRRHGAVPTVFTASPRAAAAWNPELEIEETATDVGFVQTDGVTEDVDATLALLETRITDDAIDAFAERLAGFELVVADIPPPALEAARRAEVPAVGIGNFDWAWIYRRYGLEAWADRFAAWQAPHPAIQLWPGPGLRGFRRVARFGVLARRSAPDPDVAPGSVLVAFSAHGLPGGPEILPRIDGITWIVDDPLAGERPDFVPMGGRPFPGLVAAADAVFTKPGYGIVAESLVAGSRIAWIPRGRFPEAPSLEAILRGRGDPEVPGGPAGVREGIVAALAAGRPGPVGDPDEADHIAAAVLSTL